MRRSSIILAAWIALRLPAAAAPEHDIHIGYCKAQVNGASISGKLSYYRDDFLKALRNRLGVAAYGLTPAQTDAAMAAYLREHFTATANGGERLRLTITGAGVDGTSIWFSFTFSASARITSLAIGNTVLFQEYRDQMNMVNVKSPSGEHGLVLTSSEPSGSIEI